MSDLLLKVLLKTGVDRLKGKSETPLLDAKYLLIHVLQKDLAFLEAWPEFSMDHASEKSFLALIEKRAKGCPLAYLTGSQPFWSFNLRVNENTLIPRPETEHLVECALEKLDKTQHYQIVDLGTGSGAVGLAIAKERPNSQIFAVDFSEKALEIAQLNAKELGIKNITFLQGSWYEALPKRFYDLIVSNPPYVAQQERHLLSPEVHFEPETALFSDEAGLKDIGRIIRGASEYLKLGGWLMIEHGFSQGAVVRDFFERMGFESVFTRKDYAGLERVTGGCLGK